MFKRQLLWRTPEQLLEIGFQRSPVVMMNEAHDRATRCIRTRQIGTHILPTAHQLGVRYLAMEALFPAYIEQAHQSRTLPDLKQIREVQWDHPQRKAWLQTFLSQGHSLLPEADYLGQPEMQALIQTALDLGWTLITYDIDLLQRPSNLSEDEETNWREEVQARNLLTAFRALPSGSRMLVWCGNSHLSKTVSRGSSSSVPWVPMGYQFKKISGIDYFALDQIQTVLFPYSNSFRERLRNAYRSQLAEHGGTMGMLKEELPFRLKLQLGHFGCDAFLFSTDNALE